MPCQLLHHDTGARCEKDWGHADSQHYGYSHYPAQIVSWTERVQVDKRGRRVGYNWWREYNCSLLLDATLTWERDCEAVAVGYATEIAEYAANNPRPNLKDFLLANAGMNEPPEGEEQ